MTPMSRAITFFCLLGLLLLPACAGELDTPAEALRLLGSSLKEGVAGEPYEEALRTAGGLRPYTHELESGKLPAGLELDGGVVRGTPTETGTFRFTVKVTDARLSSALLEYSLRVIEVPPPALDLTVPGTETRAAFTVRAGVGDARKLRGLSTRLEWDPAAFRLVEDSVESARAQVIMFSHAEEGWLQVDLAVTGRPLDGSGDLFRFRLEPLEAARPGLEANTLFLAEGAAGESFSSTRSGARVPARRSQAEERADTEEQPESPETETETEGEEQ